MMPAPASFVDRIARAPQPIAAVRRLHRRTPLGTAAIASLTDEVPRRGRSSLVEAERLVRAAAWLAARLDDRRGHARAVRAAGHIDTLASRHRSALRRYDRAAALFAAAGDEVEAAVTDSGSLQPLIFCGAYDTAFDRAARARAVFSRHGDRARLARLESNAGNIFFRQDRFEEALACYRRALAGLQSAGSPADIAVALRNAAVCLISLGRFDDALDTYREARSHAVQQRMPLLAAEADYNIGYLYYLRGDYQRAIDLYRAAREFCDRVGDTYHRALCDLDESELRLEVNDFAAAEHLAGEAVDRFGRLGMQYERAKALAFRAVATSRVGDAAGATVLFRRARRLFEREGNRVWPALIDLDCAAILARAGRTLAARRLATTARRVFVARGLAARAALCELLLAKIALQAGRNRGARRLCRSAIERLHGVDAPAVAWQAAFVLGSIEDADGKPAAAREAFAAARARFESLRSHLRRDDLKVTFLVDKLAVYEGLVSLAPTPAEAFSYIEEAKSRGLADLIAFRASDLEARNVGAEPVAARVRATRQQLSGYHRQIEREETRPERDARRLSQLRGRASATEQELGRRLRELGSVDADMASLQGGGITDVDAIRTALPHDGVLVEYYFARDNVYACVLSRDRDLEITRVADAETVRRTARLLRFQLAKFGLYPQYLRVFGDILASATATHLHKLYDLLIAPIRNRLDGCRLVIVPHDLLHSVPFHAFQSDGEYLADRFAISYAPSASVYYWCAARPADPRSTSLVFGVDDALAPRISSEVREVAALLPNAELVVGPDATADRLRAAAARAGRVHVATHAFFRRDNPMLSAIRLADREITLAELYDLRLSCDLLTLSGCGTGLTVVTGGDELIGLTRGLLYAGARSLLVSLWDVNDATTARFMREFYRRLVGGSGKAEAVSAAMAAVRAEHPHPYYWAPFVLVGDGKIRSPYISPTSAGPDCPDAYVSARLNGPGGGAE